jgi:hypothetical protein
MGLLRDESVAPGLPQKMESKNANNTFVQFLSFVIFCHERCLRTIRIIAISKIVCELAICQDHVATKFRFYAFALTMYFSFVSFVLIHLEHGVNLEFHYPS